MISLSELMSDPDLTESVTRIVRVLTVNTFGETTITPTSSTILAVVTSAAKPGVMRFEDAQTYADAIRVVTSSPLNGAVVGQMPDHIVWKGQTYIVSMVNDYQSFGFSDAICKLVDLQDQPNV
ncbi:MAG: hypothetical protein VST70_01660 [Nitrospirota bacterium]|nr:hypothetical protein [Nitrospirota bacterium]